MQQPQMKIELGSYAKDVITGFEGIIMSYTFHLTGCDMVALKPRDLDKDGKVKDAFWCDYTRVEVISGPPPEIQKVLAAAAAQQPTDTGCTGEECPETREV